MAFIQDEGQCSPQQTATHSDGHPQMSAVILKLAEPLLKKYGADRKRAESIILLAIAAWNRAMLPADKQAGFEKEIIDAAVPLNGEAEAVAATLEVMELIEDRRKQLFPDLRVVVASHDLKMSGGQLTLNVGSAPIRAGD